MAGRAPSGMPRVGVEAAAPPGALPCPACGDPLFPWLTPDPARGPAVDRCETCGLIAVRRADGAGAAAESPVVGRARMQPGASLTLRFANAGSLQAMLGAESWSLLDPSASCQLTARAAELLLARDGLDITRLRPLARAGMASMWQTILNLLTFDRNFAPRALTGRLRPHGGAETAKFALDALITVAAAIPVAAIAVLLESAALLARRGGQVELTARPTP